MKTALVLSAGGMFGAYQAGVWELLERSGCRPDLVVGASVGSLNAWMIASGCSGPDLVQRWLSLDPFADTQWRLPKSLSEGILKSSKLEALIREMCGNNPPTQLELGIVLTELRTMKPRLFSASELTWRHLAGSCSVPLFLKHYQIDGVTYSDGGLVDPLPLPGAVQMGASRIVAVDLLKNRIPGIARLMNYVHHWTGYARPELASACLVEINPTQMLGSAKDAMRWSHVNAQRWIDLGRRDAEEHLQAVVRCWSREQS